LNEREEIKLEPISSEGTARSQRSIASPTSKPPKKDKASAWINLSKKVKTAKKPDEAQSPEEKPKI
jgi:hypothetical protein